MNWKKILEVNEEILMCDTELDINGAKNASNMIEFDDALSAPMFDFPSAKEYYRYSSSGRYLPYVRRPMLFLHALNDPLVPGGLVPLDLFGQNGFLLSCVTNEG